MCNLTIFVFVIKAQLLTSADMGYILLLEQQVYLVLIEQFNANLISSQSLLPFVKKAVEHEYILGFTHCTKKEVFH